MTKASGDSWTGGDAYEAFMGPYHSSKSLDYGSASPPQKAEPSDFWPLPGQSSALYNALNMNLELTEYVPGA